MSRPEERVVRAGAGLVGSLMALFLARRGYEVEVLERRADLRKERIRAGRSINLAISVRGLHALQQVGLESQALSNAIPMRGRMMHALDGTLTFQSYGTDDSQCIHSISRGWLNGMLLDAAEATGRVRVGFRRKVTTVDLGRRTVRVEDRSGGSATVEAPTLLGTDGRARWCATPSLPRGRRPPARPRWRTDTRS
jgi:kynurenine 3-monooxygenase